MPERGDLTEAVYVEKLKRFRKERFKRNGGSPAVPAKAWVRYWRSDGARNYGWVWEDAAGAADGAGA